MSERERREGCADETAARRSVIAAELRMPWLAPLLAQHRTELGQCYTQLQALARPARRELQRRLARSRDLTRILEDRVTRGAGRVAQRRLARSLVGAALLLALGQGVGHAATITVTAKTPAIIADGKCSLIEAIVNANADAQTHADCLAGSGPDIIVLPRGVQTLATVDNTVYGPTGLPVISSAITIEGNGAKISRKASTPAFRIFAVDGAGDLTLKNVTVSGGTAELGGGVFNYDGTVTIQNSTISGNKSVNAAGAGIFNYGDMTIQDSVISGNKISGDYALGGGIFNYGTLTIERSTISGNTTNAVLNAGAGIGNEGTLTIRNSTISGNKSLGAYGAGGGIANYGTLTIEKSTISGNLATATEIGYGGGIANGADLTVENSTISKNTARYAGGGVANDGTVVLRDSTITGNRVTAKDGYGGGVDTFGDVTLSRSLISGNKAAAGPEIFVDTGTVTADDHNLFGANGNPGVAGFTPGASDIIPGPGVTTAKILGGLANNGGPTKTHALKLGSPALDAVPLLDPACVGTDQRGITRPQGSGCDIGAFERQ
jgi:hypothetical protein